MGRVGETILSNQKQHSSCHMGSRGGCAPEDPSSGSDGRMWT